MTEPLVTVCRDRAEWLERRKDGLGASDAAAAMGLSARKTNVELWEEKTGRRAAADLADVAYVRYGNAAEPHLRALFALDHPEYEVSFTPFKIMRHPEKPFLFCTPDGELLRRATGERGGLEIKTTEIRRGADWLNWKERIPQDYYVQVLHQMLAAGWAFVELLAQIRYTAADGDDRKEIRHYLFERGEVLEDLALVERSGARFWRAVEEDKRPNLILAVG